MITAVDTNVLLDVLSASPEFGGRSSEALRQCLGDGGVVACDVVWAETAAHFPDTDRAREALAELRVEFSPLDERSSLVAGKRWRAYRAAGGSRSRMIGDLLIGAHAVTAADRLLTRDRGFYRQYFADLRVLDPTDVG